MNILQDAVRTVLATPISDEAKVEHIKRLVAVCESEPLLKHAIKGVANDLRSKHQENTQEAQLDATDAKQIESIRAALEKYTSTAPAAPKVV